MHVYACICTYVGFRLLAHPFSPSCFLQISAHQSPILMSIVSFQSTARRHSSMLLNPLRLPRRWQALAAARAAARAATPAAAVSSSSPPIMALMSTVRLLQLRSNRRRRLNFLNRPPLLRKLSRAFLNHLHTKIQGFQAQKLNTDDNTMLLN